MRGARAEAASAAARAQPQRRRRRRRVCPPAATHYDYIESITMALLRCTGRWCRNGTRWSPLRPRAAANIAAAAGYSGRGRRPVAATPSARLFSEHNLQHTFFANKYRRCQRTRSVTIFTKSYSKKNVISSPQ